MRKYCKLPQRYYSAFTLAEMMVVMLIMSIILAAMAPVMTTRSKADSSSPWRYSPENLSDAYFGAGESQIALIGQPNKLETDDAARLILNASSSLPVHLSFKRDNTTLGRLQFIDTNLILGSGSMDHLNGGGNNISIGPNNLTQVTSGGSNIAIGDNAMLSTTSGGNNIGIGTTLTGNIDGNNNVAVGDDSLTRANSSWNTVVGRNAYQLGTGGSNTIIGGDAMSEGSGQNNVAVGTNSLWYGNGDGNVAIGANSNYKTTTLTDFTNTTAVGFSSYAGGTGSVALGASSNASGDSSVAIGLSSSAEDNDSIAIGNNVTASGESAVAIGSAASGRTTTSSGEESVAIGDGAITTGDYSVSLGSLSTAGAKETLAIGYQTNASDLFTMAIGNHSKADALLDMAIGYSASASGGDNLAIGPSANASGFDSTSIAVSSQAGGVGSTAIGAGAKAIAGNTVAIGYNACKYATGANKICIGANSGPKSGDSWASDSVERIFIGSRSAYNDGAAPLEIHNGIGWNYVMSGGRTIAPATVVVNGALIVKGGIVTSMAWVDDRSFDGEGGVNGIGRTGGQLEPINMDWNGSSNQVSGEFGSASRGYFKSPNSGNPFTFSDKRLKYIGKEFTSGLDKIRQLKVFNYTLKKDKTKTPHVGVVAQDLQKIFPDAVKKGTDGFLIIRMEDMFYAMINAIKELDLKYQAQEKRINELEARIEKLEAKLK